MDFRNILFIDTESNPETKEPECITILFNDEKFIVEDFNYISFDRIRTIWNKSIAVVMFNAPYDLGALSIFFSENKYEWIVKNINNERSASWKINIFDNSYDVRKISLFRNMIKPLNRENKYSHKKGNKSTTVIDLLKLWSILVSEKDISLKSLIKNELHAQTIPYSPEKAKTDAYRYQDVEKLKELTSLFFEKIKNIEEVKGFDWNDWGYIKTPATFTKILYQKSYPDIVKFKKENDKVIDDIKLKNALEEAYHGGITLAMHRGDIGRNFWLDIKGAYSKAIEVLNTDSYIKFDIIEVDVSDVDFNSPYLCEIETNFIFKSINKSLKLFYVDELQKLFSWNYDIQACNNLIPDYEYKILKAYKPIPCLKVEKSLCTTWNDHKNAEKALNGKTTLYDFFKFLSNTSYGIKAQRKPFQTAHTNMVIAGMITSKVHQILTIIIKTVEENGYQNKYNDTDSVCAQIKNNFDVSIVEKVNSKIVPFEVEFEGEYENTKILSLKRYISINSLETYKNKGISKEDKIKLHGKGRYKISFLDIANYALNKKYNKDECLTISQMAANTELSMTQILNLFPFLEKYKHPFMFVKNIKCDRLLSDFLEEWYYHVDTKTTFKLKEPFSRKFHHFKNIREAEEFFKNYTGIDKADDISDSFRNWDEEIQTDFQTFST